MVGQITKVGIVYIMTNKYHTVLYVGVTSNLQNRVLEHQQKKYLTSFTARYNIDKLVYYNQFENIEAAILEEKRIKGGSRAKKISLIESINPTWRDLWEDVKSW